MQAVKIVITGPFNAGKTEFIRSVSEIEVVSTERAISDDTKTVKNQTTVAIDFGRITIDDDLVLYLFGTPGQKRFDFMWEILSEGMLGFIVLIDSVKPETFREARRLLDIFRGYADTPFVVAANKQDLPDAWSPACASRTASSCCPVWRWIRKASRASCWSCSIPSSKRWTFSAHRLRSGRAAGWRTGIVREG